MTLMIYGANGYTGELIAREARARGLTAILAGRAQAKLAPLAAELALPSRAFALTSPASCQSGLAGVTVLLNCAGPFSRTAAPLIAACIAAKTHYLDITGEIPILESAHEHHRAAQAANIVICPGAGFDVVPTDCLAAQLKSALPDATELWLGFDAGQRMSPGTAKTMIEYAAMGGKIRRDGRIVPFPTGSGLQTIDFGRGPTTAMPVPWGDVASAYHTTQIPNITVFTPAPAPLRLAMKTLAVLCRSATISSFITGRITAAVTGPTAAQRDASPAFLYGRATAPGGRSHEIRFKTLNGYSLTVLSALAMAEHLLAPTNQAGAYTPSALMGQDFIYSLPGTTRLEDEEMSLMGDHQHPRKHRTAEMFEKIASKFGNIRLPRSPHNTGLLLHRGRNKNMAAERVGVLRGVAIATLAAPSTGLRTVRGMLPCPKPPVRFWRELSRELPVRSGSGSSG